MCHCNEAKKRGNNLRGTQVQFRKEQTIFSVHDSFLSSIVKLLKNEPMKQKRKGGIGIDELR